MKIDKKELKKALDQALDLSVIRQEGHKDKIRKFDESIDLIINIKNVNLKDPNARIDEEHALPNNINLEEKISACFVASGNIQMNAKKLGYEVFDEEALEQLDKEQKKEKKKFVKKYKFFIVEQKQMRLVARYLARFLGPLGKMPKPPPKGFGIMRETDDVNEVIERHKKIVRIIMKKQPLIQLPVGKKSMGAEKILENIASVVNHVVEGLPNKLNNVRSIYIKSTMGKPVKVNE